MLNLKQKIYNFLRWSQKYTQTDMVYLAKGGFWLTLGGVISTLTTFLLALAFANLLDPTIYGNYKYLLSLIGLLSIFGLAGMGKAITQAVAQGWEGSYYTGFKTKLKWGLLGSLLAIGGAFYYWLRGNDLLPIPLLISAIFLPLMLASGVYLNFLTGKKLFNIQVKYSSLSQVISVVALVVALFLTKNLFWLIAIYFISHTFSNYLFYLLTKFRFKPNKKENPKTISYGKHLSLMGVVTKFAGQLDKILLFHFLGASQLAIYSFALIIPKQIQSLLKSLSVLALPKLTQRSIPQLKKSLPGKVLKLFLIILPVVGLYIWLAPYIYQLFFPQYPSSIIYSQVFVIILLFFPKKLLSQTFIAHLKTKKMYIINLSHSFSKIILLIILLPLYGIWGAIVALLLSQMIHFLILALLFKKL